MWNKESKEFKIKNFNDSEILFDISLTYDLEIINEIIHEPFNYFENEEFMKTKTLKLMQ